MKTIDRESLMESLKGLTIVGPRTTEEFGIENGGIWISAEEENNKLYFSYYKEHGGFELGVHYTIKNFLKRRGWYAEWYDPGTIMLWEI